MTDGIISLWLTPKVLEWDAYVGSSSVLDSTPVRRAYEHLSHAEQVLSRATSPLDLVDVVTTLKRAVDLRLRLLNSYYRWRTLPLRGLPKGPLQILEALGIARHRMVTRLIEFRNAIEHGDKSPPSPEDCADLVEAVWYFLRSTDILCLRLPTEVNLELESEAIEDLGIEVTFDPDKKWIATYRASLPPDMLSTKPHDDWFKIRVDWASEGQAFVRNPSTLISEEILESIRRPVDVLSFNGTILGPTDLLGQLIRVFLSAP
jgi:hypothetical protein